MKINCKPSQTEGFFFSTYSLYLGDIINHKSIKMKKLILFLSALVITSCQSNPNYLSNLTNAKKTFEYFQAEDLKAQMSLFFQKS